MSDGGEGVLVLRIVTDEFPEKDRLAIWTEEFSRTFLKTDFTPAPDAPFHQSATIRKMPGLTMMTVEGSASRYVRNSGHTSDLAFGIRHKGSGQMLQLGREFAANPGEGILLSDEDAVDAQNFSTYLNSVLLLPRKALRDRVPDVDACFLRPVPRDGVALQLLTGYLSSFNSMVTPPPNVDLTPGLLSSFVTHVCDLAAMALGPTRDAAHEALGGGVRAARLHAVKSYIAANPGSDLAAEKVAAHHGISPRYLHRLFEGEGVTYSEFVVRQRLDHARRMLEDPHRLGRTIGSIAFEAGFADLSHFNRAFRRRFGMTPSDARAQAKRVRL